MSETLCTGASLAPIGAALGYLNTVAQLRANVAIFTYPVSIYVAAIPGVFVWNTTSTATDDGETVIAQTNNTGPGRWLVQVFGSDDAQALVTAEQNARVAAVNSEASTRAAADTALAAEIAAIPTGGSVTSVVGHAGAVTASQIAAALDDSQTIGATIIGVATTATWKPSYNTSAVSLLGFLKNAVILDLAPGYTASDCSTAMAACIAYLNAQYIAGGTPATSQLWTIIGLQGTYKYDTGYGANPPDMLPPIRFTTFGVQPRLYINNAVAQWIPAGGTLFMWVGSVYSYSDLNVGVGPAINFQFGWGMKDWLFQSLHTGAGTTHPLNIIGSTGKIRFGIFDNNVFVGIPGRAYSMAVVPTGNVPGTSTSYSSYYGFTTAQIHESFFRHNRINDTGDGAFQTGGTPGSAALFCATGDGTTTTSSDETYVLDMRLYRPHGIGVLFRAINNASWQNFTITGVYEGSNPGAGGVYIGSLVQAGFAADVGSMSGFLIDVQGINPYDTFATVQVDLQTTTNSNNNAIRVRSASSVAANPAPGPLSSDVIINCKSTTGFSVEGEQWTNGGTGSPSNLIVGTAVGPIVLYKHGNTITTTDPSNHIVDVEALVLAAAPAPTVTAGVAAAGTGYGTATAITTSEATVTSATSSQGVRLPALAVVAVGGSCWVYNRTATSVAFNIYPDTSGHTIESAAAGVAVVLPAGASAKFLRSTSTAWIELTTVTTSAAQFEPFILPNALKVGNFYNTAYGASLAVSGVTVTANRRYAVLFAVTNAAGVTLQSLSFGLVTAPSATINIEMCVFGLLGTTDKPGAIITGTDTGTVNMVSPAVGIYTPAIAAPTFLAQGFYYASFISDTAITISGIGAATESFIGGFVIGSPSAASALTNSSSCNGFYLNSASLSPGTTFGSASPAVAMGVPTLAIGL